MKKDQVTPSGKKAATKSRKVSKKASRSKASQEADDQLPSQFSYVGARCREARESIRVSRNEVAESCDKTVQQIYLFEQKNQASLHTFLRYLNMLYTRGRVNPAWLILEDNSKINLKIQSFLELHAQIGGQVRELLNLSVDFNDFSVTVPSIAPPEGTSIKVGLVPNPGPEKDPHA